MTSSNIWLKYSIFIDFCSSPDQESETVYFLKTWIVNSFVFAVRMVCCNHMILHKSSHRKLTTNKQMSIAAVYQVLFTKAGSE